MAVYCCVEAGAKIADAGVIVMPVRFAPETFNCAVPVTPSKLALTVADPAETPAAIPLVPERLLTLATALLLDDQLTLLEITCVLESLNCPVAANVTCVPGAMEVMDGVTEIDTTVALVTFTLAEAVCDPRVAVTVEDPGLIPCNFPLV